MKTVVMAYGESSLVAPLGRLLRIDLDGPTAGTQRTILGGLDKPFGLLLAKDRATAYVSEHRQRRPSFGGHACHWRPQTSL